MNMRLAASAVFVFGMSLASGSSSSAALVGIEFRVPGNLPSHTETQGGPLWTGIVDTTLDTLTIYTWIEQADSIDFWSPDPTSMPLVWSAVDNTGAPFDVPDGFDGIIDSTFAFISPQNVHEMTWLQSATEGGPLLPIEATFYPGWGGARYIPNLQTELVYDTDWSEEYMPRMLTSPQGLGIVTADDGIVTLVDFSSITPVPEASQALAWSVFAAGGLLIAYWRRLRSALAS